MEDQEAALCEVGEAERGVVAEVHHEDEGALVIGVAEVVTEAELAEVGSVQGEAAEEGMQTSQGPVVAFGDVDHKRMYIYGRSGTMVEIS